MEFDPAGTEAMMVASSLQALVDESYRFAGFNSQGERKEVRDP